MPNALSKFWETPIGISIFGKSWREFGSYFSDLMQVATPVSMISISSKDIDPGSTKKLKRLDGHAVPVGEDRAARRPCFLQQRTSFSPCLSSRALPPGRGKLIFVLFFQFGFYFVWLWCIVTNFINSIWFQCEFNILL